MLRSIVICPDEGMARDLESAVDLTGEASVQKTLYDYPTAIELVRTIRAYTPSVIFLSFESISLAQAIAGLVEAEAPHIPIIAINGEYDDHALRESMRMGVREFIAQPFKQSVLREAFANIQSLIKRKTAAPGDTNQIFSFLPSKAGVGASTVALNVSAALAQKPDTRVLLSDFDLNSGMMRFLLKLGNDRSVADAVENSLRMDENLWPQMVTAMKNLHVLHAGPLNPSARIDSAQILSLIAFMRHNYQALCFDMSGNLEKYSLEIMQESKRVLLVCTPEKSSLLLAREKLEFLRSVDLGERVGVVLNRCPKNPLFTVPQVEDMLGLPVLQVFPNDYVGVNKAISAGTWMPPQSELGKQFSQFADMLLDRKPPEKVEKKKFLDFFALSPARTGEAV
jgi:pilus assembly protein CpaE